MTGRRVVWVLWLSALVLSVGILAIPLVARGGPSAGAPMAHDAETVDLAALDPEIVANYRFGAAHQEHLAAIDCYCGCVEFLAHTDLAACFITAEGAYEPHAAGCAVCNGEATLARTLLEDGVPIADVVRQVDGVYGTTVGTAPPLPTDRSST